MCEEQDLEELDVVNELNLNNFGHADEDAGDAGGVGHAHGAHSALCGQEKVRCACICRLSRHQAQSCSLLAVFARRPWRSGVDYEQPASETRPSPTVCD